MDTVMKWVYSFAEYVESDAEYNFSKKCLKEYLREKKNVLGQGLASSVDEILTSFFAKERYVCHHAFMGCTHFNFKGDSIVEAENAIHKKKAIANATLSNSAQTQMSISSQRHMNHLWYVSMHSCLFSKQRHED